MPGEQLQRKKENWTWHWMALPLAIVMIVLGVFVIARPESTLDTIFIALGAIVLLRAGMLAISTLRARNDAESGSSNAGFVIAAVLLIIGIFLIVRLQFAIDALILVAAGLLILDSLSNMTLWPRLLRHNGAMLIISVLATAVTIAAAAALFMRPEWSWFSTQLGIGVGLFAEGVTYLLFGIAALGLLGRRENVIGDERSRRKWAGENDPSQHVPGIEDGTGADVSEAGNER
ncbi:DUF308 domain-containing protein [Trueperella sp. LYQ143]|uniref:DUF308 domain-containing protein n=1 Tax=unclassified Trueperella TaxID=2630174 RepID=UPI0039830DCD